MKIGSEEHKQRFCRQFIATHCRFDPATLVWPELDEAGLERLRNIPFWQEVLYTERRAGAIVNAYAQTIADRLVREAIALQGFEEARHAELLRRMMRRYQIDAEERPVDAPVSADLRHAFTDFGYGECLDSFLGFGVFKIARRARFLPEPLFDIFDMLMREETRHIVFFVNWAAWQQMTSGRIAGWLRGANAIRYYCRAIGRLLGTIRRGRSDGKEFSATQASVFLDGFSLRSFVQECCDEHERRMAAFDPELLRPCLLPKLAGIALTGLRLGHRARPLQGEQT
ncbi:MAG TPA: ferritin-like domain-containing protein [Stellaceae bacterium]|jgi:hypothetical protein|nr:ferritin-like domain-containing protein [Stellaceae bacterium]